jgi:hypothetical protein
MAQTAGSYIACLVKDNQACRSGIHRYRSTPPAHSSSGGLRLTSTVPRASIVEPTSLASTPAARKSSARKSANPRESLGSQIQGWSWYVAGWLNALSSYCRFTGVSMSPIRRRRAHLFFRVLLTGFTKSRCRWCQLDMVRMRTCRLRRRNELLAVGGCDRTILREQRRRAVTRGPRRVRLGRHSSPTGCRGLPTLRERSRVIMLILLPCTLLVS